MNHAIRPSLPDSPSGLVRRLPIGMLPLAWLLALGLGACTATGSTPAASNGTDSSSGNNGSSSADAGSADRRVSWEHVQQHWMSTNTDPRYPRSQWLVGIGVAPYVSDQSFQDAETAGRQAIVEYFETQIEAEFQQYQEQIVVAEGSAPPDVRGEVFSRSSLRAIVSGSLAGGDVAGRATDPQRTVAYALVVVNRRTMADNLKVQIEELQSRIRSTLAQARSHRDSGRFLGALRGYSPIVAWHQQLVALVQQYNLARPAGYPPIRVDFDLQEILDEMVAVALKLTFAFKIEPSIVRQGASHAASLDVDVEGEVIRQLGEMGVEVTVMRSTAAFRRVSASQIRDLSVEEVRDLLNADLAVNYVVTGTLKAEYADIRELRGQRMPVYRVTYELEVIELSTSETIRLSDAVGRSVGAGTSDLQAARQGVLHASRQIAEELAARFSAE